MNVVEIIGKTPDNKIEVAVRSEGERDQHGLIVDPYAHIMAIATQMGYSLTIQDLSTNFQNVQKAAEVPASASGGPIPASPYPHGTPQIEGTQETDQL